MGEGEVVGRAQSVSACKKVILVSKGERGDASEVKGNFSLNRTHARHKNCSCF
jgi:hypothetical protein